MIFLCQFPPPKTRGFICGPGVFMRGYKHDVISSIYVSTAFLQADEYEPDAITRHVYMYYQPGPHMPRVYYKLRGCLHVYGQRTASMEWYRTEKKIDGNFFEGPGGGCPEGCSAG